MNKDNDSRTSAPKRRRGRPSKVDATDVNSIISKIEEQEQRFSAKCATKLDDLFAVIYDIAVGDTQSSIKDQVGAAKYCIEKASKFLESHRDEEGSGSSTTSDRDAEEENRPLVSVVATKR